VGQVFKRENRKETVTKSISTILMLLLFFVLTFMSVKTLIAYFESKKIRDYDVHFANLEIALYNVNNEEFTSITGDSVPLNGILPGDTIPINIGKVVNKSNTSVYALANLVVTIEPITPRTQTLVLSTWYNLNGDKIKVSNFEKNEIPATKLKANVIDDDGFTINYTLPGNKVTNAYKMGKVSASFGVYGIQSFLPEIENQAREPELEVCEIIVSRLANQEFEEEAYVNLTIDKESGTVQYLPGDEDYNTVVKNINRTSCGLYLDEEMTIPVDSIYEDVYAVPEGTNVYTKWATPDKLDFHPTDGTCSVTGSSEITGEVVIPKTYYDEESGEEIPVTKIEASAFAESYMTSLITPDGLLEIDANALKNCPDVTYVKLPDTLTTLGSGAFFGCTKLTNIDLSETQLTSIGGQAFYQCTSLESIVVPNTVTKMGSAVYAKCTNLKTVTLSENLKGVLDTTFSGCTKLESVNIPEGITALGYEVFFKCSSLSEIVIPSSCKSIGHDALNGCTGVKKFVVPASCSLYGANELNGVSSKLEVLEVYGEGENLKNINGFLIYKNETLKLGTKYAIDVPEGITTLWQCAVMNQTERTTINLDLAKDTLTTIGSSTFSGCTNLTDVIIPENVTSLGGNLFQNCSSLKIMNIPETVAKAIKTIPSGMFLGCSSLESVTIPEGITKISTNAFNNAGLNCSLTVILPESLTSLEGSAFYKANIDTIYIPSAVTIGSPSVCFYENKIKNFYLANSTMYANILNGTTYDLPFSLTDGTTWYVSEDIDTMNTTGKIFSLIRQNQIVSGYNGKNYVVYTK